MEGLKECTAELVVYIHPSKAKAPDEAILHDLSSMLFTYNESLEGVVLAYDPQPYNKLAKILPGIHPYFGVKLATKFLLFDPKPNMILEGEVVKITPRSIHAVVLGFSSAVVMDEDIRGEFKHKFKRGQEVYISKTNRKHKIKVGTILRFVVKSFDEEVLHLSGSLLADHTGCARWLDQNMPKNLDNLAAEADSTAKKRKIAKDEDKKSVKEETPSLKHNDKIKKSKKKSEVGEDEDKKSEQEETPSLKSDDQIKKSKKKRKEHS